MGTGIGPKFGNTRGALKVSSNDNKGSLKKSVHIRSSLKKHIKDWAKQKKNELTGKTKKNFNTACVVFDAETGKYYYGRNGGYLEKDYIRNPQLFGNSAQDGILPKSSFNKYPIGNCAEVDAVNRALNDNAKLSNLYMTTIHTTKKQFGEYKSACENCTYTFKGKISDNFSGWYREGEE